MTAASIHSITHHQTATSAAIHRSDSAIRNKILKLLPPAELSALVERSDVVEVKSKEILFESEEKLDHVYFPEDCVISLNKVCGQISGMARRLTAKGRPQLLRSDPGIPGRDAGSSQAGRDGDDGNPGESGPDRTRPRNITVVKRPGLEKASCECYRTIRARQAKLIA